MKLVKRIAGFMLAITLVVTAFAGSPAITAEAAKSTKAAAQTGVAIGAVLIQGADVVISSQGTVASEDGMYHLIASDVNQTAPVGTEVAQAAVSGAATFSVPLAKGSANSMLYKKFTVCVMSGGALKAVSNSMFITNPEACAGPSRKRKKN